MKSCILCQSPTSESVSSACCDCIQKIPNFIASLLDRVSALEAELKESKRYHPRTKTRSLAPTVTPEFIERFWSRVDKRAPDECWLWTGTKTGKYGVITITHGVGHYRRYYAHSLARWLTTKEWPAGSVTCHSCDTPLCCNPAHLFVGTQNDNIADMIKKQRQPKGDNHYTRRHPEKVRRGEQLPQARLKEEDIRTIRKLYSEGVLQSALAKQFGVKQQYISAVVNRQTWKHVI